MHSKGCESTDEFQNIEAKVTKFSHADEGVVNVDDRKLVDVECWQLKKSWSFILINYGKLLFRFSISAKIHQTGSESVDQK